MSDKNKEIPVNWLFNSLKSKQAVHYPKIVRLNGELVYLSEPKTVTRANGVELLILISFDRPKESFEYYTLRCQIETLFKSLKSSGLNIEETHVTVLEKLDRLIQLVMIAYTWCYLVGVQIDKTFKEIKIKTHGRRALSVIKYGLDYISMYLLSGVNKYKITICDILSCT